MKIAVTGASGFVGRHILRNLQNRDAEIVVVTRDATKLGEQDGVRIVEMDISTANGDCFRALGKPDVLIHLAWDGLPNYRSLHHFESELPSQYRFLSAMVAGGLCNLAVTGTCFEYGMQSGPLHEETLSLPINPYGFAKDALRRELEFLKLSRSFNLTWARLFYMYGEGQPKSSLYSQLREAVRRGDRVFNMSGGEQLRDFLPVDEVAKRIVELAVQRKDFGVVNVCSGIPVSVRTLVERWIEENGWNIELNFGFYPYPDYEPMAFWGTSRLLEARTVSQ